MKLASLKDGSRDGQLMVVSRDLSQAHLATAIAPTLQSALDDWPYLSGQLDELYQDLNNGKVSRNAFAFAPSRCMAPLPRAFQWAAGSAYVNHVELVHRSRKVEMPDSFWLEPLLYQGASDDFIGPTDPAYFASADWGIDFEAELAVITDDVPFGVAPEQAGSHIKLLVLANDWSLRNLICAELAKGFGFLQSKPATSFSPVAVSPDELGDAWQDGRVHLPLSISWNGKRVGNLHAGTDMTFNFPRLISHLARTRRVRAGSMIGSGAVSNQAAKQNPAIGYGCIAEIRAIETLAAGQPNTAFMQFGDTLKIEMLDAKRHSIFGAIDQTVTALPSAQ